MKEPAPKAKTPGTVTKDYKKNSTEDKDNTEAATVVAEATGRNFTLVKPNGGYKVKSADAIDGDGKLWEIKTNNTATKSAIDNALRSTKGQSDNVILNVKSSISDKELLKAVKDRVRRTNIKVLDIVKDGKVYEYTRDELLK